MRRDGNGGAAWQLGRIIALLALLGQLMGGGAIPASAMWANEGPFDGIPICHTAGPDDADTKTPPGHPAHTGDCALCPVCHALNAVAPLPAPPSPLLLPVLAVRGQSAPLPRGRAPPASPVLAATYPTGPPYLA